MHTTTTTITPKAKTAPKGVKLTDVKKYFACTTQEIKDLPDADKKELKANLTALVAKGGWTL